MSQIRKGPLLNRKETQTLLNRLKIASVAGVLSLTLAGWATLAQLDATAAPDAASQNTSVVAALPDSSNKSLGSKVSSSPTPTARRVTKLDIVQWVQDVRGNQVAVVRDRRGTLWFVMGSDVPRIEQGLAPQVRPQPVQMTTRSRAS